MKKSEGLKMPLEKMTPTEAMKKLFVFNFKININSFHSLIIFQLLGMILSIGGIGERAGQYFHITYYTADYMIIFTMIWMFFVATQLISNKQQQYQFIFISNRLVIHLANGLYLFTLSIIGAVTALLSRFLSHVIGYFIFGFVFTNNIFTNVLIDYIFDFSATILFIFLTGMFGYMIGALIQLNRLLKILLPTFIIIYLIISAYLRIDNLLVKLFYFYFTEP